MKKLLIPIAHSFGLNTIVLPSEALKQRDAPFKCLKCDGQVYLRRKSKRNQAHFAHTTESAHACDGVNETIIHLAAKLIMENTQRKIVLKQKCASCALFSGVSEQICTSVLTRKREYAIGSFIVDVACLDTLNAVVRIFEVKHTHAIDKMKWKYLMNVTHDIHEVNANDVVSALKQSDDQLVVCYTNLWRCEKCETEECANCLQCNIKCDKVDMRCLANNQYVCLHCCEEYYSNCSKCHHFVLNSDFFENYEMFYNYSMCTKCITYCNVCKIVVVWNKNFCYTCSKPCPGTCKSRISVLDETCVLCQSLFIFCIVCKKINTSKQSRCSLCHHLCTICQAPLPEKNRFRITFAERFSWATNNADDYDPCRTCWSKCGKCKKEMYLNSGNEFCLDCMCSLNMTQQQKRKLSFPQDTEIKTPIKVVHEVKNHKHNTQSCTQSHGNLISWRCGCCHYFFVETNMFKVPINSNALYGQYICNTCYYEQKFFVCSSCKGLTRQVVNSLQRLLLLCSLCYRPCKICQTQLATDDIRACEKCQQK